MMTAIVGRGRSGKSYEAVRYHIIPAIKSGRKVITNIPLNIAHFKATFDEDVEQLIDVRKYNYDDFGSNERPFSTPECYQDEWRNKENQGPLYVIDEAHMSLKRGQTKDPVKEFYTMHGHRGIDIVLLTQHIRQVDTDICYLIDIVISCTKNRALGFEGSYTRKVKDGYRGAVTNEGQRTYNKAYFKFYKSHTASKGAVNEATATDVKPIWSHWSFKGFFVLLPIGLYFTISSFASVLDPTSGKPQENDVEAVATNEKPVPQLQEAPAPEFMEAQQPARREPQKQPTLKERYQELKEQAPPDVRPVLYHPFKRVQLAITGNAQYTLKNRLVNDVYFSASRNGQHMFELNLKDLYMAGYTVQVLGDCLVRIEYGNFSDHIVCDIPVKSLNQELRDMTPSLGSDNSDMEFASN